jgi:hypothetical protein
VTNRDWVVRDGYVLCSLAPAPSWAGHVVRSGDFEPGVGALRVSRGALVMGSGLVQLDAQGRVRRLRDARGVHVVLGRRTWALAPDVVRQLHVGDVITSERPS